jgi:hypothetical protein
MQGKNTILAPCALCLAPPYFGNEEDADQPDGSLEFEVPKVGS